MHWEGSCVECRRKRNWLEGIFCANYYHRLGTFTPCRQMWCGRCYISAPRPRNGDHTLVPFECDLCIFRKQRKTDPGPNSYTDKTFLAVIRRANLDAFWSTMTDTVNKHVGKLKTGRKISDSLGLDGPYVEICSLPPYDHCGYEVAIHMLMNSLNPGRISKDYTQWDTIRKLRTCCSNYTRASNQAHLSTLAINDNKGVYQHNGQDVCGSF